MSKLKPIALLIVTATLLIVGTPGLDFLNADTYSQARQAKMRARYGTVLTAVGIALNDLNRSVRRPLAKRLGKFQTVFRVRQSWHVYRDGPRPIRRMEIRVDDTPVYRTNDEALTWLKPQLRSRRIRPMVEMTTKKFNSANWKGLTRYVVHEAREEWPEAQKVELVALSGPRPGRRLRPTHRITATAPDWDPRKTR
jgi:hypothetical protein